MNDKLNVYIFGRKFRNNGLKIAYAKHWTVDCFANIIDRIRQLLVERIEGIIRLSFASRISIEHVWKTMQSGTRVIDSTIKNTIVEAFTIVSRDVERIRWFIIPIEKVRNDDLFYPRRCFIDILLTEYRRALLISIRCTYCLPLFAPFVFSLRFNCHDAPANFYFIKRSNEKFL